MNMKTNSNYKLNKYSNQYIEMKTKFKYTYKLTISCQLNIYILSMSAFAYGRDNV